jgi:hypothetical protein
VDTYSHRGLSYIIHWIHYGLFVITFKEIRMSGKEKHKEKEKKEPQEIEPKPVGKEKGTILRCFHRDKKEN